MISSMTAFARQSQEADWGMLTWELRSVNHRYLEITLRLPDFLRDLEKKARDLIQQSLTRGKLEAVLRFQPGREEAFSIKVNTTLAQQLANAGHTVAKLLPSAQVNVMDVLAWPGVLQTEELARDIVDQAALDLLQQALTHLIATRNREGDGLKSFILERLASIKNQVALVEQRMPLTLEAARKKIMVRFDELSVELDQNRLEQEMVWIAQKADIAEELQRLTAHVSEVERVLQQGGVAGRRLDFLMQELNREANTLSSKSSDSTITQAAVELKVQIEQIREQVQNIE